MKKFTSLSTFLKIQILLVLTAGVLVIAATVSYRQYQSAFASLSNKAKTTLNVTSKSISDPVWNFNEEGIEDFSKALLEDADVHFYELLDGEGKSLFRSSKDQNAKTFADVCVGGRFLCESKDISRESKVIGKINVAFSLSVIQKAVIESLSLMVGLGLGVILFLAVLISRIVSKVVKDPLNVLGSGASELSAGNLDYEFTITQNNEIGQLAQRFTAMRDAIKSKIADLKRLNEMGQKINQISNPNDIRDLIARASNEKLRADGIGFFVPNGDRPRMSLAKTFSDKQAVEIPDTLELSEEAVRHAIQDRNIQTLKHGDGYRAYLPIVNEEGVCYGLLLAVSSEEIKVSGPEASFLETLTRTAAIRLENLKMVATIEEHNRNLEKTVELRTRDLAKALDVVSVQKNQIAAIVDNVQFGLLRATRDGSIQDGYSRSCNVLLSSDGQSLSGKKIWDVLSMNERGADNFSTFFAQVFDVPFLADELVVEIPQHHVVNGKDIALQCFPIMADDEVESILFSLADVTLAKKMERENEKNKTLIRIVQNKDRFRSLLTGIFESDDQMLALSRASAQNRPLGRSTDLSEVKRQVHTWKGDLATFGLGEVAGFLHKVEDTLGDEVPNAESDSFVRFLKGMLNEFLSAHYDILKISPERIADSTVNLEVTTMNRLLENLAKSNRIDEIRTMVQQFVQESTMDRGEDVLAYLAIATREVAKRLEKDVQVDTKGAQVRLPNEFRDVIGSLIHVVRNAVDHGVEEPAKRAGKNPKATVSIAISESPNYYQIVVSDDGKGIDLQKLKESLIKRGLTCEDRWSKLTLDQKMRQIFVSNVSTKEVVTDISGRGVGLDSVVSNVESIGGSVHVSSKLGEGTVFDIRLPRVTYKYSAAS